MAYNRLTSCPDLEPAFVPIYEQAKPYTLTSLERMYAVYQAVEHVVRAGIPGDWVECGVWKGGSSMAAALSLLHLGQSDRALWLYDTFEGMTPPDELDRDYDGQLAQARLDQAKKSGGESRWAVGLDAVREAMDSTGYPAEQVRYVPGKVEDTLSHDHPQDMPERIAVLRLDTDWYASTKHEMEHLYPRLIPGGVLIIDDYGHWQGCRKAVDEYFAEHGIQMLLTRQDYTGRMGIKP